MELWLFQSYAGIDHYVFFFPWNSFKDVKSLSMDRILRSSSGYKKARLAAVSQLDNGETQPDEIVPDSQGNLWLIK